jgi:hypothetical protein
VAWGGVEGVFMQTWPGVTAARRAPAARPVQGALPLEEVDERGVVIYRFTLPFLPPSKNSFDGWPREWKSGTKKKWQRHVAARCRELNLPLGMTQIGLSAKLYFPTNNRRDPQNYAQCLWNFVPDALVGCTARCAQPCVLHAGVLVDDNQGRIEFGPNLGVQMVWDRRKAPKKVIERTSIAIAVRRAVPRKTGE